MKATQSALLLWGVLLAAPPLAAGPLPPPSGEVILTVSGAIGLTNVDDEARLDAHMLAALPRERLTTHTSVTDGPQTFEGFLARDLLAALQAKGETVTARALNDYLTEIPAADFERYDVMLADTMNGERLTRRDKGPLWIVYPRDAHAELQDIRYDYRWVWQLRQLEIE
ncbi:molybdopterin-dependent oxidoreductase [Halomonas sp. H10-9-1]|uniref:molybdopterin-dependent oxidoreductase n=1 Tax=Halomonas sp. H10-9-1 TaxID=2950871 RepID=UPI0032DF6E1D